MKKLHLYLLALLFPTLFIFASCSSSQTDDSSNGDTTEVVAEVNEAKLLVDYLEGEGGNFINTNAPTMIKAKDVHEMLANSPEKMYIMDFRKPLDFANGHIDGAVNVKIPELLNHVKGTDLSQYEKVVAVCYTGQSASFATSVLRLLGHNNVFAMKWGMSTWTEEVAESKWLKGISNDFADQLETEANDKAAAGELPTIMTGKETGKEILEERATNLLSAKFTDYTVKAADLFANPGDYYIVNYWPQERYAAGHIPGAIQYDPKKSLHTSADLMTLPTDKKIVIYCYTGQHSAYVMAYLRILGYDAYSLLYGANSFMNGEMVGKDGWHGFDESHIHNYETIESEPPAGAEASAGNGGGGC